MPSVVFGDMNPMIGLDANDEYRSYMLENIDLKLLRMFSVVARVGSFTRSAMLIDVTQSAVSHGIKRLESQLGCSLFYKKGKSIHLTPERRFFLGHVQRLLDLYDRTIESVGKRFQEGRRNLNVTFAGSVAYFILAPVLREFRESYPDVSVIVRLEDSPLGLGVAIMAPWVAARELQEGSLVARPFPKVLIRRSWSVVHQAGRELSQAEQTFLGLCRLAAKTKIQSDLAWVTRRSTALVLAPQNQRYAGA